MNDAQNCIHLTLFVPAFVLLTCKTSLFIFITFCLRLNPLQQPLKVPWNLHALIHHQ